MAEKKFNPADHLIPLKGGEYLEVKWRLVWFREEHPDWCIVTEMVEHFHGEYAVFHATITDPAGLIVASGHGSESVKDFRDYLEKAETKAIGRALAMAGYGTQFAPELDEGERIVDAPVDRNSKKAKPAPKPAAKAVDEVLCSDCKKPISGIKMKDGSELSVAEVVKRSVDAYGRPLCLGCSKKAKQGG